jgi:hypothetical protein
MFGQRFSAMKNEIARFIECSGMFASKIDAALAPNALESCGNFVDRHIFRCRAFESEQDGFVRAVAFAGQCQRTVEVRLDARRSRE